MNRQIFHVLLISQQADYELCQQLNEKIEIYQFILHWKRELTQLKTTEQQYDIYLVTTLDDLKKLSQTGSKSVILITDKSDCASKALEVGAIDYLVRSQISVPVLERSLRLALADTSHEAFYASIFNHAAEVIFLLRVEAPDRFVVETINPAGEQATGQTLKQVAGKTITEILPVELATACQKNYRACLEARHPIEYQETLDFAGEERIWRTILVPISNSSGQIVKIQGSTRDITAEKQGIAKQFRLMRYGQLLASVSLKILRSWEFEEILQIAVTEVQAILGAERVVVLRLGADGVGKIIKEAVLEQFPAMLGKVIIDRHCRDQCREKYQTGYVHVCSDTYAAGYGDCYLQLLEKYQIRANLAVPIMGRINRVNQEKSTSVSGSDFELWDLIFVQQCSQPRQWTEDEIEFLQQLATHLSVALEQARLREQETWQRQELARSNSELEQFAYIASHDLQEPLQTVANFTKLLERRYKDRLDIKANRYIEHIVDGVKHLQAQINDLLTYSRIGTQYSSWELTDFQQVIKQAIANLQNSITRTQARIKVPQSLPSLAVDQAQMVQLWQNLIANAIKYRASAPPVVQIDVQRQEANWLFSVTDNGIGIVPQYSKRIFQIFERLHTQDEYPGTGIGLAICQKIVTTHGGQIWVESELGQGAKFFFTLPS